MGGILNVLLLDQVRKMSQCIDRCETMACSGYSHDGNQYFSFFHFRITLSIRDWRVFANRSWKGLCGTLANRSPEMIAAIM